MVIGGLRVPIREVTCHKEKGLKGFPLCVYVLVAQWRWTLRFLGL